jgi:hypothetical protein
MTKKTEPRPPTCWRWETLEYGRKDFFGLSPGELHRRLVAWLVGKHEGELAPGETERVFPFLSFDGGYLATTPHGFILRLASEERELPQNRYMMDRCGENPPPKVCTARSKPPEILGFYCGKLGSFSFFGEDWGTPSDCLVTALPELADCKPSPKPAGELREARAGRQAPLILRLLRKRLSQLAELLEGVIDAQDRQKGEHRSFGEREPP